MIKINLATRKQSAGGTTTDTRSPRTTLTKLHVNLDGLQDLPLRKVGLMVVVAIVATYLLDDFKESQIKAVSEALTKISVEQTRLKGELSKTKGYDELKKVLDADEATIRNKIETIQKLIDGRQNPPKTLISLAKTIPPDVWIGEFKVTTEEVILKGNSIGYNQISDFMKGLNETSYFTDLHLVSSAQGKDDLNVDVTTFELAAKRN